MKNAGTILFLLLIGYIIAKGPRQFLDDVGGRIEEKHSKNYDPDEPVSEKTYEPGIQKISETGNYSDDVGKPSELANYVKTDKTKKIGKAITVEDQLDYVKTYSPIAIQHMRKYGILASISLAQGLLESRAGTSDLAVRAKNHFGIKCMSKNCKNGHCVNKTDDTHKDFFRRFNTIAQSWEAHSELISEGRYAKLQQYGKDYRAWAFGLKEAGYATRGDYAEALISIIERLGLDKYDKKSYAEPMPERYREPIKEAAIPRPKSKPIPVNVNGIEDEEGDETPLRKTLWKENSKKTEYKPKVPTKMPPPIPGTKPQPQVPKPTGKAKAGAW